MVQRRMSEVVHLRLKNDRSEIKRLNSTVESIGRQHRLPAEVVFAVKLSLEEVFTDIVSYAHDDDKEHFVEVSLSVHPGEKVVVTVEDDGKPFNPLRDVPAPNLHSPLEKRRVGGLGFHLVKGHMDSLDYERREGKNILTMVKRI